MGQQNSCKTIIDVFKSLTHSRCAYHFYGSQEWTFTLTFTFKFVFTFTFSFRSRHVHVKIHFCDCLLSSVPLCQDNCTLINISLVGNFDDINFFN